jgi:hypothetical protein
MKCQDRRMLNGTSGAYNLLLSNTKNAGQKPAFPVQFLPVLRTVLRRFRGPANHYGVLGAAGVVVEGVGLVPKSTLGGASVPDAASKYVRGFAPVTFAVIACGKVRM